MRKFFFLAPLYLLGSILAPLAHAEPAGDNRNWVAMNVFDSFYPMTDEQTFPDVLGSIETIYSLYTKRLLGRDIRRALGGLKHGDHQGDRSREGHFTLWIHLSDRFLRSHPVDRDKLGNQIFMFQSRNNDIFTGWSGSVNLAALLTQGVKGFGVPLPGHFQNFEKEIAPLGDADFEGGWYMTDEQAERILTSFTTYGGLEHGYSFMSFTSERPNAPYDPAGAQLGNGYNCGDFAFYALDTAGVISKEEAESLKIRFWYPKYYFDHPLPLEGAGAAGARWLQQHPDATSIPQGEMVKVGWSELLFGPLGLRFWDKGQIARDIVDDRLEIFPARIWDQAHVIDWLKHRVDFVSKGIWTELLPAVLRDEKIYTPERTVPESAYNRFVLSRDYRRFQREGHRLEDRKLKQAGISGFAGDEFKEIFESLKRPAVN